ncbi:MAG: hypothetical protein OXC40_07585, partial [Proteobacteria bacterium]|nr:hypothetical protein [Pseudomonadota bacterium]
PLHDQLSIRLHRFFALPKGEESKVAQDGRDHNSPEVSAPLMAMTRQGGGGMYMKESYQNLGMTKVTDKGPSHSKSYDQLMLRVFQSSAIFVQEISKTKPVAYVAFGEQSVPSVGLLFNEPVDPTKSVSDDQPISVRISGVSPYPLRRINLIIETARGQFRETVTTIMANSQLSIVHNYSVHLAPYIFDREEHVHLIAEVIATAQGDEIIGLSEPLAIRVSSSYGRYKQALQDLGAIRKELMMWQQEQASDIMARIGDLSESLAENSQQTSFFNLADRINLEDFQEQLANIRQKESSDHPISQELIGDINEFLTLHEELDDRERDRDFFVASRLYAQKAREISLGHQQTLDQDTENMMEFLAERRERWQERVAQLGETNQDFAIMAQRYAMNPYFTEGWQSMDHAMQQQIRNRGSKNNDQNQEAPFVQLSSLISEYRVWLDALELNENKQREQARSQHMSSLASAEATLKMMRKSQDNIASRLDLSATMVTGDQERVKDVEQMMAKEWHEIKQSQTKVQTQAEQLRKMLSQVPGLTTDRIGDAIEAMKGVKQAGGHGDFYQAEELADQASRLLREGAQDTKSHRSRQKSRQSLHPRKSVIGNEYYGNSIVDMSLTKEHSVDQNYREAVLRDMSQYPRQGRDQSIQKRYLREMLR